MPNADEIKGRAKEAAGSVTGDESLKNEGRTDQGAGKVKGAIDDVKDTAKDAVDGVTDKLHKN